ncbi:MAG: hydantoinase B/oxoprolinase family protein [Rhizobiaceae bacterium]|nr:hydantoinase B/oxoprolinase family protein [Rhizobiaceae bacterium]
MSGAELAVLRSRIDGIVRNMATVLLRTGRSGVINRAKDLSCCIVTHGCELLSAADGLPIHVLSGPEIMARTMAAMHPDIRAGDAFLNNSPYHGCSHAADHTILVPIIDVTGTHHFTILVKAHQADIGNSKPTTYFATASDLYEEGALIFPNVRVQQDYRTIQDVVEMCRMRIRVPDQWYGDFLAMIGAARSGERDLLDLAAEIGWDRLHAFTRHWFDYSEERMAQAIKHLPAGIVSASSTHDPMPGTPPEGLVVRATVSIDPEAARIDVDFRENDDALDCGLNVSEACSRTAALIGVFNSVRGDIPKNAGSFRRINVRLREGAVVGIPQHPISCSVATTNVADRAANAVQLAFAELADGLGAAEVGPVNPPAKGVVSGNDPRTGRGFINQLFLGSTGGPGSSDGDCWLTYSHVGNGGMSFIESVEMTELHHPIHVAERRLVPDTEGAGQFRGAPSLRIELAPVAAPIRIAYVSDGVVNPARGARGGGAGGPAGQVKRDADGVERPLPNVGEVVLAPGESVISIGTGGGGYGDPLLRNPALVATDVAEGLLTPARALSEYAVVVDSAGAVALDETSKARRHRAEKAANKEALK